MIRAWICWFVWLAFVLGVNIALNTAETALLLILSVFIPFVKVFPHIYGISSPPGKDHSVDEELAVRSTNE